MRFFKAAFFALCLALFWGKAEALEVPSQPDGYVTDKASLLSASAKAKLEQELRDYEQLTTNQIVVVILPTLEGDSLEDFSIRLAEKWKVGQKGKDNGVILLIFPKDRKLRIEVGYGLEGALPDALAGQIIQAVLTPNFRRGEYEQGIFAAVSAIELAIKGEFKAASTQADFTSQDIAKVKQVVVWILIMALLMFCFDSVRYFSYCGAHRSYPQRYSTIEWWIRFSLLLAALSLLFRLLFYALLMSRGGGGSSGGGFSGGGGSFGGGGSSGSW